MKVWDMDKGREHCIADSEHGIAMGFPKRQHLGAYCGVFVVMLMAESSENQELINIGSVALGIN